MSADEISPTTTRSKSSSKKTPPHYYPLNILKNRPRYPQGEYAEVYTVPPPHNTHIHYKQGERKPPTIFRGFTLLRWIGKRTPIWLSISEILSIKL